MDAEVKAKWVAALRSGEYEQGKGRLRKEGRYCCLGVLDKIEGWCSEDGRGYPLSHLTLSVGLAREVWDLMALNDGGKSFEEIADWIEANL